MNFSIRMWWEERDLNPQAREEREILSLLCLPFHHLPRVVAPSGFEPEYLYRWTILSRRRLPFRQGADFGWGVRIRTFIRGVKARCPTVERCPIIW